MGLKEIYDCLSEYCPYFWKDISRNVAENILREKPVGSFLLRSSEEECDEFSGFAISFVVEGTSNSIKHGHIFLSPEGHFQEDDRWICINIINLELVEERWTNDVLIQAINRFESVNTQNTLKSLAMDSIIKLIRNMPRKMTDFQLLGECEEQIFKLFLPNTLKKEIFAKFLIEHAEFCWTGILPDLC